MVDRYIALLPPKPSGAGKLLLASSRWGDVVVVDATACDELESARWVVSMSQGHEGGVCYRDALLMCTIEMPEQPRCV
jgi:hypothetical protein